MCLLTLALDESRRFPLVVAANRDEYFARATARLAWWAPEPGAAPILGGRDLDAGGTWLGLSAEGRLGLLTNVRSPARNDPAAPSRGRIVPQWLAADERVDQFWMRTALSGYNGFNLLAADFAQGECFWANNDGSHPLRLERGLYGLSNAGLDAPWPKVDALKVRTREAIAQSAGVDELAGRLFDALADRRVPPDHELPDTGVGIEKERMLAPAFIRSPDLLYGTRCSTLIITERTGRHNVTHVLERSFSPNGGMALLRRATLNHWPPRYNAGASAPAMQAGAVTESEVDAAAGVVPAKRSRVRSLLRPPAGRRRG
ncbi:NRDE family protein [Piscinibacter sp.]|uniref:NRDE family protein n=1 Tax=Piscinibacter sp. TaxID=1903157 RepID=UPI0039E2393F